MKKLIALVGALAIVSCFNSCKKEKGETTTTDDASLFAETQAGGFTFYQSGAELNGVSPSPHGLFKLRFNAIAQAALGSDGELAGGNTFPTGSLIVKELRNGGNTTLYVVMKKDPGNVNAANGWLWAEYNVDGTSAYSLSNKGSGCTGCHGGSPNRDYTQTFDLH